MAKEYNISRPAGTCGECGKQLQVGDEFVTVVRDADDELSRNDYCMSCWKNPPQGRDVLGVWHSKIPPKQEKKRLFVDDDLLVNLFTRLEGADDPSRINLRFVLALVLMRKRLLSYDGMTRTPDGREMWNMRLRGAEAANSVENPHMDDEKIADVSRRLGEILEGELE